jgi:hypothetical protein
MRIDTEQMIAGHASLRVRRLLQRGAADDWGVDLVEEVLGVTPEEAVDTLAQLATLGFIRPAGVGVYGKQEWSNTVKGNALANATAARPIRRPTAERALREFLGRVSEVNGSPDYLYAVSYVVVFGSFLSDRLTLNDVDLALELVAKETDPEVRSRLREERVAAAMRAGRRFADYRQEVRWPRTEVWLRLKSRSRTLSLHDLNCEAALVRSGPYEVIFSANPAVPVPPILRESAS